MKKRWLKLAAIGIMTGTLMVQAPVAAYAGENGEATVMEAAEVAAKVVTLLLRTMLRPRMHL